jgi:NAD dependent epimerase/dehydratase family enzyme
MKVIITGSTGLVGSAVIREAIANDSITHAFVLSRKDLPKEIGDSAKVTVIPHADFSTYPEDLLTQLAGCEACIWCVIARPHKTHSAADDDQGHWRTRCPIPRS